MSVIEAIKEKAVLMIDAVVDHKQYRREYVSLDDVLTLLEEARKDFPDEDNFCSWETGDAILDKTKFIAAVEIWFEKRFLRGKAT